MNNPSIRLFRLLALLSILVAGQAQAASTAERADALLLDMLGAVGAVQDYQARFVVQVRQDNRMRPPEGLLVRQRRHPGCLYMKWLSGVRLSDERVFCSDQEIDKKPVRRRARTLANRKALSRAQIQALQVVLRPMDDDGLYGMVARYANQYFDAAQNAQPGDFIIELRQATVFKRPASCLRIRRREPIEHASFQGQSELCVDNRSKLPSAFRQWDASGLLLESYLMGDYQINKGLSDTAFTLAEN